MPTQPWIKSASPKLLVIGHDPRLNKSNTLAIYSLFSNYYFDEIPKVPSELKKYQLAEALFNLIRDLTSGIIIPEEVCVTNLCNDPLPHAPIGKTVYIPEESAIKGIKDIKKILEEYPSIQLILPMSLQVNYWLQKLNFCTSNSEFVSLSEPRKQGIVSDNIYYKPQKGRTFLLICGKIFKTIIPQDIPVIPILHVKNFPLKENFLPYLPNQQEAKNNILHILNSKIKI